MIKIYQQTKADSNESKKIESSCKALHPMKRNPTGIFMKISTIIETVKKEVESYKVPVVDLIAIQTKDPFKILVATILSARTKDETTAMASARLFKKAPDLTSLKELSKEDIRSRIYPFGFPTQAMTPPGLIDQTWSTSPSPPFRYRTQPPKFSPLKSFTFFFRPINWC